MIDKNYHDLLHLPLLCTATAAITILLQFQDPFWSVITVIVLYTESNEHPILKASWRLFGTIIGAIVGVMLCIFLINNSALLLLSLFIIAMISAYCAFNTRHSYAFILGGATCLMVIFPSWTSPSALIDVAIWRSAEVVLGVLIVTADYILIKRNNSNNSDGAAIVSSNHFAQSLSISIGCLLTAIVCLLFSLQGGAIGIITAFVLSLIQNSGKQMIKGAERIVGCIIGAAMGLLCLILISHSFSSLLFIILVATFIYACFHYTHPLFPYTKLQAIVAFLVALLPSTNILTPTIWPALERVSGILIGLVIITVLNFFLISNEPKD